MIEMRFASADDAAVVLGFVRALAEYEKQPEAVEVSEETLRRQLAETPAPFEALLAIDDGRAVGFALFFHTYSTWRGKRGIWLEDLFVLPDERRRGVGKMLLARVAAIAVERGCARFEWTVLEWNRLAIDFYEGLGAQRLEEWRICRVSNEALEELARR
jgi:GNAT superfamily N-acetyltransferase